jgi:hypothetical protein
VLIKARFSDRRYTAASSQVSKPTRRLGSCDERSALSASDRSVGPIFAAQPHVRERPVNVFFFLKRVICPLQSFYFGTKYFAIGLIRSKQPTLPGCSSSASRRQPIPPSHIYRFRWLRNILHRAGKLQTIHLCPLFFS